MKNKLAGFILGIIAVITLAFVTTQNNGLYILNTDDQTQFKIRGPAGQTAAFLEFVKGGSNIFTVTAGGGITANGLQSGTATTASDKTVTQAFSSFFASAPVVVVTGGTNDLAHVVSITTTNVKLGAANASAALKWIAIGTP